MALGRPNLGHLLLAKGIVTAEQLSAALEHQAETGERLGTALVRLEMCTEREIARALADQLEVPFVDLERTPPNPTVVAMMPREVALEYGILPLRLDGERLLAVVRDPHDISLDAVVRRATGRQLLIALGSETQLREALRQYYSLNPNARRAPDSAYQKSLPIQDVHVVEDRGATVEGLVAAGAHANAIDVVNTIVADAARRGASDVRIEPGPWTITVRYRIDGEMHPIVALDRLQNANVVSRIKVMCEMDTSDNRRPQDGYCRLLIDRVPLEIRASTLPGIDGEAVALRLLYQRNGLPDVESLGLGPQLLRQLKSALGRRQGLLLTTGPTGSGKTTTLYAALSYLNNARLNIITVEDPVESNIPGITQVQVDEKAGRTFATTLRAMLRQDPDILMVGEIRDPETASISCRAALTGHLVLSTLHTTHALGTVARLQDMGIPPYVLAASLGGIIAQRLAKRVCESCATPYAPPTAVRDVLSSRWGMPPNARFRRGTGCKDCHYTGCSGRIGIYEFLEVTEDLRRMLFSDASSAEIRNYAESNGFRTMEDDAFRKACQGLIPPEEVARLGMGLMLEDVVEAPDYQLSDLSHAGEAERFMPESLGI